MPKDSRLKVNGKMTYEWNPFQDLVANRVTAEPVHVQGGTGGAIVIPLASPLFSRNFKIRLKESGRELSMERGEFSFLYPFGDFIKKYNRLVYGAIQINNVTQPTDFEIDYDTIGGDFVLNDIAYAEALANTLTSPRTIDWSEITNLPTEYPPDPHEHPASDTMNYGDLIVWMHSYLDAVTNTNNSLTVIGLLQEHLDAGLKDAHKATLEDLGITHLKDWAMGESNDVTGNSTELLVNIALCKELIRGFAQGVWR